MTNTNNIRLSNAADLPTVALLMEEAFGASAQLPINPAYIADPNIHCFVLEIDNTIVATAALHILQKVNRKLGQIEDVVVAQSQRGKGLGKTIVTHLLQVSADQGCYKTILNATDENIPFYNTLGFRVEQNQLVIRH